MPKEKEELTDEKFNEICKNILVDISLKEDGRIYLEALSSLIREYGDDSKAHICVEVVKRFTKEMTERHKETSQTTTSES